MMRIIEELGRLDERIEGLSAEICEPVPVHFRALRNPQRDTVWRAGPRTGAGSDCRQRSPNHPISRVAAFVRIDWPLSIGMGGRPRIPHRTDESYTKKELFQCTGVYLPRAAASLLGWVHGITVGGGKVCALRRSCR
jgi:hypothetical protein